MKSQVLHTVWCYISGEAAGEIWHWSLMDEFEARTRDMIILFHILFYFILFQFEPPPYRVENMATPTAIFSGSNDKLSDPQDVDELRPRIANLEYSEEIPGWNHADFLFGIDAPTRLYSKILDMMAVSMSESDSIWTEIE